MFTAPVRVARAPSPAGPFRFRFRACDQPQFLFYVLAFSSDRSAACGGTLRFQRRRCPRFAPLFGANLGGISYNDQCGAGALARGRFVFAPGPAISRSSCFYSLVFLLLHSYFLLLQSYF